MEEMLQRNKELVQGYREVLFPEGYLVGVKMLKTLEGFEKVKRLDRRLALCQLISQVRYYARTRLATNEDEWGCYAVPGILGFGEMPKEAWKRYVGWQFKTEEAVKKSYDTVPMFERGEYSAIFLSPLERCPVKPDVVIFFGNSSQMLLIIAAYLYDKGGALTFSSCGMCSCASLIVGAMKEGKPIIVIPSNASKLLAVPSDTDLLCGIPGDMVDSLLEGMQFLRPRGGSRYPPAWQHIDWEPQAPIGDVLKTDGRPTWLG